MLWCVRFALSIVTTLAAMFIYHWYPVHSDSPAVTHVPLPRGNWAGRYAGAPTVTPAGPMATPLNFTITEVEGTDGSMWLMEHFFEQTYLVQGSHQQFWVSSFLDPVTQKTTSNLTYCGVLRGFNVMAGDLAFVQVNLTEVTRNDTYMEWDLNPQPVAAPEIVHQGDWTGKWTLTLLDGGDRIVSHFMLPRGEAEHTLIEFRRVDDSKPTMPKPTKMADTICRVNFAKLPGGPNWNSEAVTKARFGSCPLGFTASRDTLFGAAPAIRKLEKDHDNCYMVNRFLNFTIAWNWKPRGSNDVDFVITTTAKGTDDQYVAIGFNPLWPAMKGMDIILGYLTHDKKTGTPTGCVRSMHADKDFGTPAAFPEQEIKNTRVWVENGLLHVGFTRPAKTGTVELDNTPISYNFGLAQYAFAMGTVDAPAAGADMCTGKPQYHGFHRGVGSNNWAHPSLALPEHMLCSRQLDLPSAGRPASGVEHTEL